MARSMRYKVGSWLGTGALLTTAAAALSITAAAPAGAVSVSTEAAFTTAWETAGTTAIDLSADVTLTCASGEPTRNSSTAIVVNGGRHTLRQTCAGDGVLEQQGTGTVTVNQITISGGDRTSGGGGGINAEQGDVVVTESSISGNHTAAEGGAIQTDGSGDVTVTDSAITDNSSGGSGGGIASPGVITLVRTSVQNNTSGNNGGGMRVYGSAQVIDSTITGNTAASDGGALDGGPVSLVYATIVGNTSDGGSNLSLSDANLDSFGSVVAQPGSGSNCIGLGTVTSTGYNVEDGHTCGFGSGPGDIVDEASPLLLGTPADNGGFAQTLLPDLASPLVDLIPTAACDGGKGITEDQRLLARPQGSACDVGAVEVAQGTATTTTLASTTTVAGTPTTVAPSTPAAPVAAAPTYTG